MTICVKRAKLYPRWMNVFLIVQDKITWCIALFLFVGGVVIVFFWSEGDNYISGSNNLLDIWGAITLAFQTLYGVASNFRPHSFMVRLVYFSLLYSQLLVSTIVCAHYMSFVLRKIARPQVSTTDEIFNLNYQLVGSDAYTDVLNEYTPVSWTWTVSHSNRDVIDGKIMISFAQNYKGNVETCKDITRCLDRVQQDTRIAVMISRLFMESSNYSDIYCFDRTQTLHTHSNVFMIRSDLMIFNEFVDILERIITSGLIPKWMKDRRITGPRMDDNAPSEPFLLRNALGSFFICSGFFVCALLAAIAEQIIFRQYSRNPSSRFWQIADKLIDGKRHYFVRKPIFAREN